MPLSDIKNVVLIGPMAAGKSSVGKLLAALLNIDFIDTDKAIEEACGIDISRIFEFEGEAGFRKRETAVIRNLIGIENHIIATGGGTILALENRKILLKLGAIVYLRVTLEQILERTSKSRHRPLLEHSNQRLTVEKLLVEREPIYSQMADVTIHPDCHQRIQKTPYDIMKALAHCNLDRCE